MQQIDWVTGSFGSKISMLYPMSILNGEGAKTEIYRYNICREGTELRYRFQGTIHNAQNTSSVVNSKSISKDGGICTYRSLVKITENAKNSKCSVSCKFYARRHFRSDTIL